MYSYTYRITKLSTNKHYYGVRKSKVHPKEDLGIIYFSSAHNKEFREGMEDNLTDYKFKIIKIFDTYQDAMMGTSKLSEINLHIKFDVVRNKSFYNGVTAKDDFTTLGLTFKMSLSDEEIKNRSERRSLMNLDQELRDKNSDRMKKNNPMHDPEVAKRVHDKLDYITIGKKVSEAKTGMVNCKDKVTGESFFVSTEEFHTNDNLVGIAYGTPSPNKGKTGIFTDEQLKKMSDSHKGAIASEETKIKISNAIKEIANSEDTCIYCGHINKKLVINSRHNELCILHPDETKRAANIQRNKDRGAKNKGKIYDQIECPHCSKIGGGPSMVRFHFDNCKAKKCL